jgi:hypothetical protein
MSKRVVFGTKFAIAAMLSAAAVVMSGCQSSEGGFFFAPRATLGADRSSETATRLPCLMGPDKSLAQFKGPNGLLVVFVDTACPFAEVIVGGVDTASNALSPRGVPTVLVSLDDPQKRVQEYFRGHAVNVPVLYDTTTTTKDRWKITRVPTMVLLDSTGHEAYVGYGQWVPLARAVETTLGLPAGAINIQAESTGLT